MSALTDLQLSVYNEPSHLHVLDIKYCQDLKSLVGLKNLCSLGSLYIAHCPKLVVFRKEKLSFRPQHVFIDDCPGLVEWCDEQELCYQVRFFLDVINLVHQTVQNVVVSYSFFTNL